MSNPDIVKQLSNIKVDEISLVDRGANQHAKVLISKRLDEVGKGSPTSSAVHHEKPLSDKDRKKKRRRKKRFANAGADEVTVDTDEDKLAKADDDEDDLAALLEAVAQRRKRKRMSEKEQELPEDEESEEEPSAEDDGEESGSLEALFGDEEGEEEEPEGEMPEGKDPEADAKRKKYKAEAEGKDSFQTEPGEDPEFDPEAEADAEDPENPDEEFGPEDGMDDELGDQLDPEAEAEDEPKPMPGDLPEEVSEYVSELERTVDELERRFKEESKGEVGKAAARNKEEVAVSDTIEKNDGDLTQEEVSFLEELTKSFHAGEVDADEYVSKAMEEVTKAQKAAEEASELAKAERDLRMTREYITKVADEFPHLPVDANELGPVLKAAEDALSEEQFETLSKALTANDAISKSIQSGDVSIFSEVGKKGGANPASSEVDAQADAMIEKGEAKTHEEAIAKLYAQRPELYDEYLADNQAQTR